MMKMTQDNNLIDRTSVVYAENDTELSWSIRLGVVRDEKQKG